MAIRVRKLAKRLGRSPVEVLGVLHAIGIERYRSPEDMLSGTVEQKLLRAVKDGVRPVAVGVKAVAKSRHVEEAPIGGLFPDVKRQKADPRFEAPPSSAPAPAPMRAASDVLPSMVSEPAPAPAPAQQVLDAEREAREALEVARQALAAEREALAKDRASLAKEREALEALQSRGGGPSTSLEEVFERRGLRGANEFERAIRALAEARRISEILPYLCVNDPVGLEEHLRTRLLLVDGQAPASLSGALVSVAGDRAEVPGAAEWRRLTSTLSETLLLQGARRVLVIGGPARMHRLLAEALDPRIEIRFRPAHRMTVADAEADVQRTDAIALWNVSSDADSDAILDAGRASVARIERPLVRALLEGWTRDLAMD